MRLGDISASDLPFQLRSGRVAFSIGRFSVSIRSALPGVSAQVAKLYADYQLNEPDELIDFAVELAAPSLLRRWLRPQVWFLFDGRSPFKPLPQVQAFAMFEWGLNWCIANHAHEFLVVHAAVVERNGRAFIFPGMPGSGKSTLCAALVCRGWRLLSDEMALISLADGMIHPVPRPVSLKNASIEVIRKFEPAAVFGTVVEDTAKGMIAHMQAPATSVIAGGQVAEPSRVVFPRYRVAAAPDLCQLERGTCFMQMAENSFNYNVLGGAGFDALADTVERCECYTLSYARLEDAISLMESL